MRPRLGLVRGSFNLNTTHFFYDDSHITEVISVTRPREGVNARLATSLNTVYVSRGSSTLALCYKLAYTMSQKNAPPFVDDNFVTS